MVYTPRGSGLDYRFRRDVDLAFGLEVTGPTCLAKPVAPLLASWPGAGNSVLSGQVATWLGHPTEQVYG